MAHISRAFACAKCDKAIHDGDMIVVDTIKDGEVIFTDGPFHTDCDPTKENENV